MVRVFRKKGTVVLNDVAFGTNIDGLTIKRLAVPNMRIKTIDCRLTSPIAATFTFVLREKYQNTTKDIATISFASNNMTGTTTFNATNAPNNYYDTGFGFGRGAVFQLVCTSTTYTGDVELNTKLKSKTKGAQRLLSFYFALSKKIAKSIHPKMLNATLLMSTVTTIKNSKNKSILSPPSRFYTLYCTATLFLKLTSWTLGILLVLCLCTKMDYFFF